MIFVFCVATSTRGHPVVLPQLVLQPIGENVSNGMPPSGGGRYKNPDIDQYLDAMKT